MKFLCLRCDEVMAFAERQLPGDGTMAAVFGCPGCGQEIAMLTNPMETQLVSSLGVKVGGRSVPEQPMEMTRSTLAHARPDAFGEETGANVHAALQGDEAVADAAPASATMQRVQWDDAAVERLARVPTFVRGMVKRIYTDWAKEHGVYMITPQIMDRARTELGLEGM
jgi:hypothetical protein